MATEKTVRQTLDERKKIYGDFNEVTKKSFDLKNAADARLHVSEPYQAESIDMILHKIARILVGDSNYIDNWIDIAGYATLAVEILERHHKAKPI